MKRVLFLVCLGLVLSTGSQAQLKGLMKKVQNKVQQRADSKVDKTIDKTLDKAEGEMESKKPGSDSTAQPKVQNAGSDAKPAAVTSFAKYDFVPGDSILYYDNFDQDASGELPLGWNTSGSGEVVTLDRIPGKWLKLHQPNIYLTRNEKSFGENYTIEFDMILQLKNTGYMYPWITFGMFATGEESTTDNKFLADYRSDAAVIATLAPGEYKSTKVKMESVSDGKPWFTNDAKTFEALEQWYGQPIHVAINVQKSRMRMWINAEKVYDLPKAVPAGKLMNQLQFEVHRSNYKENEYGIYLGNLKVATGIPDTRHRLLDEGRFSTSAILFDVNTATIKPESEAVIRDIANVLKENPAVKIRIIGHTDSDGKDTDNQTLSEKRAAAVKEKLAGEYGIDADRIETAGKGESEPVADNKTKEGKAANRRVEFVKL